MAGPRRRTQAYAPAGGPTRYSTAGTGGAGYGYSNQQSMSANYGGASPAVTSYGYSGMSSYGHAGSGKSNAAVMLGAGFLGGAAAGVGSYYLYNQLRSASCIGYACCYGCHDSCYRPGYDDCKVSMQRTYYRDDLMKESGFIPKDEEPFPLSIRIFSVSGQGYAESAICPPSNCTEANCTEPSSSVPNDLFVTLTAMQELSEPDTPTSHSHGPPLQAALGVALANALLRSVWMERRA